jgi:dCTP deaminase
MSALSTEAIVNRINSADLDSRLVISPLLDAAGQAKPGQASIDVRLGFDFCLVTASSIGAISEFDGITQPKLLKELYRSQYVPFGRSLVIHPHQFILAQTLEYLRLPPDLMAYVVGRSTWGRLGLIVATAVGIHPGFAGSLTLELRNLGEAPITLYPGQTIAQLFFHQVIDQNGVPSKSIAKNTQYVGSVEMVPQKLSSDVTHRVLENLVKKHI